LAEIEPESDKMPKKMSTKIGGIGLFIKRAETILYTPKSIKPVKEENPTKSLNMRKQ